MNIGIFFSFHKLTKKINEILIEDLLFNKSGLDPIFAVLLFCLFKIILLRFLPVKKNDRLYPMEFEYGFFGTSVDELLEIYRKRLKNLIIFDDQETYGTTYKLTGIEKYLKNLKYFVRNEQDYFDKLFIESYPRLFITNSAFIDTVFQADTSNSINFISITNHYVFYDKKFYKIPYNDFDIACSDWMDLSQKVSLQKFVNNFIEYEEFNTESNKNVLKILNMAKISNRGHTFPSYLKNYGQSELLCYPIYGEKEISDHLSRMLAFRNVCFYIDESVSHRRYDKTFDKLSEIEIDGENADESDSENEEDAQSVKSSTSQGNLSTKSERTLSEDENMYREYEIRGKCGSAYFEKFLEMENRLKKRYFQVLILTKPIKEGNCFFSLDENTFMFQLDWETGICPVDIFVIYIYSNEEIRQNFLETLEIDEQDVVTAFSFENGGEKRK